MPSFVFRHRQFPEIRLAAKINIRIVEKQLASHPENEIDSIGRRLRNFQFYSYPMRRIHPWILSRVEERTITTGVVFDDGARLISERISRNES